MIFFGHPFDSLSVQQLAPSESTSQSWGIPMVRKNDDATFGTWVLTPFYLHKSPDIPRRWEVKGNDIMRQNVILMVNELNRDR